MKILSYAGIGSRNTPDEVCNAMIYFAISLSEHWTLRSGFAAGADKAFFAGAAFGKGDMKMFIPWEGFNNAPRNDSRFVVPTMTPALLELAKRYHPAWDRCGLGAQKLHARNGCQVLGEDLRSPADMIVCWTVGGRGQGGTGQAIRIARDNNIPVFDLAISGALEAAAEFTAKLNFGR